VEQLLGKRHQVRLVVRSAAKLSAEVQENPNTTVTEASLLDLTDEELQQHVKECDAVVSCLGHVGTFKGVFGEPKQLCTDATRRLCAAIEMIAPRAPIRFVLMNTALVQNADLNERRSSFDRGLLTLLRHVLPPHRDNETAAQHLQQGVGKENSYIEWCCVRPGLLTNGAVSAYELEEYPSTGILKGRPTARSNVAAFMSELVADPDLWDRWKFKMPVILNAEKGAPPVDSVSA
jgi:hypothetical protein